MTATLTPRYFQSPSRALVFGTAALAVALAAAPSATAAVIVKENNTDNLDQGSSWVGPDAPGSTDIAQWDNNVTAANVTVLGSDLSWSGITILDPGGAVTINAGNTLTLGAGGIDMSAAMQNFTINSTVTAGANQTWDIAAGRTLFLTGPTSPQLGGTAEIAKMGDGTVRLTQNSDFTGKWLLNEGTLSVSSQSRLGNSGAEVVFDGGNLEFTQTSNSGLNTGIILRVESGGGTITMTSASGMTTISAANRIVGSGDLVKTGPGTVRSTQSQSTFTGDWYINEGTLRIVTASHAGAQGQTIFLDGGTLAIESSTPPASSRTYSMEAGGGTIEVVGASAVVTVNNPNQLTGPGSMRKSGPGTLELNAAQNWAGETIISGGTLRVGHEDALGAGPLRMGTATLTNNLGPGNTLTLPSLEIRTTSSQTATLNGPGHTVITGPVFNSLSGTSNLIKGGTGTLTLEGANTYNGTTAVSGGTLELNGTHTGGGLYTVGAGGTLAGTGSTTSGVSLEGRISPGGSVGSLTTGSQTWLDGGSYLVEIEDAIGGAGVGWDLVSIQGSLDLSGLSQDGFTIEVATLFAGSSGEADNFDSDEKYVWEILTASGGISGFSADKFVLDTSGFINAIGDGAFAMILGGNMNSLLLTFTPPVIPEPSTAVLLLGLASAGLTVRRRRR